MPALCAIELRFFCLHHFITHCYDQLGRCKPFQFQNPESDSESEDRFLQECADQASQLVSPLCGFDNLDRARLFDIFLWATELSAKRGFLKPAGVNAHSLSSNCDSRQGAGLLRKVAGRPGLEPGSSDRQTSRSACSAKNSL